MPCLCALDLVISGEQLARTAGARLEGEAHDAFDAGAREDRHFGGRLHRVAAVDAAAVRRRIRLRSSRGR